jgi:probable rRNA maturation factor
VPVDLLLRAHTRDEVASPQRQLLKSRVRVALRALGRARSSATIVLTDDLEIRALNRDFRKHDRATDVLSFQTLELDGVEDGAGDGVHLGDIVISVATAHRRAAGKRLGSELERLAIHGLCHLFGYDHQRRGEAEIMFALERRLRRLPLPRLSARGAPGRR